MLVSHNVHEQSTIARKIFGELIHARDIIGRCVVCPAKTFIEALAYINYGILVHAMFSNTPRTMHNTVHLYVFLMRVNEL